MTEPLKSCPFCGGEAEVEREGTYKVSCVVTCTDCGARQESADIGGYSQWNTRTSTCTHTALDVIGGYKALALLRKWTAKRKAINDQPRLPGKTAVDRRVRVEIQLAEIDDNYADDAKALLADTDESS